MKKEKLRECNLQGESVVKEALLAERGHQLDNQSLTDGDLGLDGRRVVGY